MKMRNWLVLVVAGLLALTGCEDATGGGGKEIEVYAVGNGGAVGLVLFDASVALVTSEGAEVPVSGGQVSHVASIEGARSLVTRRRVDAVEYTHARIRFTRVEADVESGLTINGVPYNGRIDVDVPSGGLALEYPVDMAIAARSREVLVIDLGTATWLPTVDRFRRVPTASFAGAVSLRQE